MSKWQDDYSPVRCRLCPERINVLTSEIEYLLSMTGWTVMDPALFPGFMSTDISRACPRCSKCWEDIDRVITITVGISHEHASGRTCEAHDVISDTPHNA